MSNRIRAGVAGILFLLAAAAPLPAEENAGRGHAIYERVLKSTALILNGDSWGTGWVVNKHQRLLVTNYHVVAQWRNQGELGQLGEGVYANREVQVVFPEWLRGKVRAERSYYRQNHSRLAIRGRVLATRKSVDLAVIQVDRLPDDIEALDYEWRMDAQPRPGDRLHSVGNPGASDALWVYSSGTVRSVHKKTIERATGTLDFLAIETQSPLNRGDSGGPVVNDAGKVVAIVQGGIFSDQVQLMSYCISVEELSRVLGPARRLADDRPPDDAYGFLTQADALFDRGEFARAAEAYSRAMELAKDEFQKQDARLWRAYSYLNSHRLDLALADLNEFLRDRPYDGDAHYHRGLVYVHKKEWIRAIEDFNQAHRLGYRKPQLFFVRGKCYQRTKQLQWAIDDHTRCIRIDPTYHAAYIDRGDIYFDLSRRPGDENYLKAYDDYSRALALAPAGSNNRRLAEEGLRDLRNWAARNR